MKSINKLPRLGLRSIDSPNGGFMVHHNSESSLVVEVKPKKHLHQSLIELKESVLSNLNESLTLWGWCLEVSRKVVCSECIWFEEPDS